MPNPRSFPALAGRLFGLVLALGAGSCFDGEELTDGLACTRKSHCGGDLQCIGGFCMDPADMGCDTDPFACQDASASASVGLTTAAPAESGDASLTAAMTSAMTTPTTTATTSTPGECGDEYESCYESGCCDFGVCVNYGNGTATCQAQCGAGYECASCCCVQLEVGGNACVETSYCGQEAQCFGGCSSAGSACYSDGDCCNGGRCLVNSGGWNSCFKPCVYPTDCVSGCCNYNATIGSNVCEAC